MSNMILLYLLILGTLPSNMHRVSTNAAESPCPRQGSSGRRSTSGKKSSVKKMKRQQRRQQAAGAGAGGAQLNFSHDQDGEEEEEEEWDCFPGSTKESCVHL